MYSARDKIYWFAIYSRLIILVLQFVFNFICPDHEAGTFVSPTDPREPVSIADDAVNLMFGGLTRWDGQYFLHIAKYGYTYENTIAFYPLFPIIVRCFALIFKVPLFFLNSHSVTILTAVLLNFICFVKSALIMYDLSKLVLKDIRLSYKATILYCINPASIFFSAVYSESVFAFVTFYTMYMALKNKFFVFLPMSLSIITRANGITNLGFPLYVWMKTLLVEFLSKDRNVNSLVKTFFYTTIPVFTSLMFALVPFGLLQINNYNTFCVPQENISIPLHVIHHAIENNYHLVGQKTHFPAWCNYPIPFAYSYVQSKYWNVGFLNYYEYKQIPNFFLAIPILFIMLKCIYDFYKEYKNKSVIGICLGKWNSVNDTYTSDMFPFIIHGTFLTIFAICFLHIQVSTRFLASSSPLLYWYCAILMNQNEKPLEDVTEISYEDEENVYSTFKVFFMTKRNYTLADKLILIYFVGYIFLGCFMFSNFLPWT